MQTFLPYPIFSMSAKSLDNKRLGKQRVEAMQVYKIITGQTKTNAWKNHPAVKMWNGYHDSLAQYYNCIREEWINRGFKNTMPEIILQKEIVNPSWLGKIEFHISHMSNLIRKDPLYYNKFAILGIPDNMPYVWPV